MCVSALPACTPVLYLRAHPCVPGVLGGQKRVPGPLELKLQVAVRCRVGAGNLNSGHLQDQQVLLVPEPSLQPL